MAGNNDAILDSLQNYISQGKYITLSTLPYLNPILYTSYITVQVLKF